LPNRGHFWSDEEESDVITLDYAEFYTKYRDSEITYDAYRHKKRELTQQAASVADIFSGVEIPAIEPGVFVGLNPAFWDI